MIERYLKNDIMADLADRMVFIGGPRQVGKTTLARALGEGDFSGKYAYLNWDSREDRRAILAGEYRGDARLVVFDEVHKYKNWKNLIKGEFDKHRSDFKIIVTGSSRLDVFRRGGDSLLGRYRHYRLHPLSLAELLPPRKTPEPFQQIEPVRPVPSGVRELLDRLMAFGGFPAVYLSASDRELRRWHNERIDRLVREDIRDLEHLKDLHSLQVMVELLPSKVGSLLSLNSLTEDLAVTHRTVSLWAEILERFYYHFRIQPFQHQKIKSLRKEPKLYLWDWSEVGDEGARFENLVASHLLKFCHLLQDRSGFKAELFFLRDRDGREVDFLVAVDRRPWFCVETKLSGKDGKTSLDFFRERLDIPQAFLVVREPGVDRIGDGFRTVSAEAFCAALV